MKQDRQHRIVVGVSGSRASIAALRWAAGEAKDRHARLDVVRACEERPPRAPYAAGGTVSAEAARTAASRELAAILETALGTPGAVVTKAEVADGLAERALVARCDGADLLVLGAHAPSGSVSPPVGPVIRACLTRAPCPVVIVTPDDQPARL